MNLTFLSSELHLNSNSYFEILEIQFKRTTPQFQTSESVYLSEVVELSLLKQLNNVFHQVASWEMYFTLKTLSLPTLICSLVQWVKSDVGLSKTRAEKNKVLLINLRNFVLMNLLVNRLLSVWPNTKYCSLTEKSTEPRHWRSSNQKSVHDSV